MVKLKTLSYFLVMWMVTCLIFWSDGVYAQHLGIPHLPEYKLYCSLSCFVNEFGKEEIPNVACDVAPCLPSYHCGARHQRLPFNDTEREYIVKRHNEIRSEVLATDMLVMSYDKELEFLASCWANQCMESPRPSHARDRCRATSTSSHNGQNTWANASLDMDVDWSDISHVEDAIATWNSEKSKVTDAIICSYTYDRKEKYEYYTQMVWAETKLVGCGRTQFSHNKYVGVNIVCNYSPGGNKQSSKEANYTVYTAGQPPCSKVEKMKSDINDKFPKLCGTIRPLSEDSYQPPFNLNAINTKCNVTLLLIIFLLNMIVKSLLIHRNNFCHIL